MDVCGTLALERKITVNKTGGWPDKSVTYQRVSAKLMPKRLNSLKTVFNFSRISKANSTPIGKTSTNRFAVKRQRTVDNLNRSSDDDLSDIDGEAKGLTLEGLAVSR